MILFCWEFCQKNKMLIPDKLFEYIVINLYFAISMHEIYLKIHVNSKFLYLKIPVL